MNKLIILISSILLLCSPALAEPRTWTEKESGRTITASLEGVEDGKVQLVIQGRGAVEVDMVGLSDADLVFLSEQGYFDWKQHRAEQLRGQIQPKLQGAVLGELLHENQFTEMLSGEDGWVHGVGDWSVAEGELKGQEIPSENHVAAGKWNSAFTNVVVAAECKFSGATSISYRFDAQEGHLGGFSIEREKGRVIIPRQNYTRSDATPPTWLGSAEHEVEEEKWYPVILQSIGETWTIYFDGTVYQGSDPACALKKTNFGFIVAGESASFRNLSIWEADVVP